MISIGRLGVNIAASTSSRNSVGMASSESTMRIITWSSHPPAKPAIAPHSTPNVVASSAAVSPISSEVCPPTISSPSTSLPTMSVPNRCAGLGTAVRFAMSVLIWLVR